MALFKCRLKNCNYETSAHDRTVVIMREQVGIAEWHFGVVCRVRRQAHMDTHAKN